MSVRIYCHGHLVRAWEFAAGLWICERCHKKVKVVW